MLYAFDPMFPKLLIADDSDAKQMMLEGFVRHHHWKFLQLHPQTKRRN